MLFRSEVDGPVGRWAVGKLAVEPSVAAGQSLERCVVHGRVVARGGDREVAAGAAEGKSRRAALSPMNPKTEGKPAMTAQPIKHSSAFVSFSYGSFGLALLMAVFNITGSVLGTRVALARGAGFVSPFAIRHSLFTPARSPALIAAST